MSAGLSYVTDTGLVWLKESPLVRRKSTDHIQIHHTVGKYGTPAKWAALQTREQGKGNRGVPYSYLVLQDGAVYLGRGHEYGHGGVKDSITNNANQRSVAIALDGDMRADGLPADKQLAAALRLTRDMMALYRLPAARVLGHNEIPTYIKDTAAPTGKTYATLCPCIDMAAFRAALGAVTPEPKPEKPGQPAAPVFPALYTYAGDTSVNVRGGPGTAYGVIGRYPPDGEHRGEPCIVLGIGDGWAEIVLHGRSPMLRGYCVDTYLRRA